MVNSKHNDNLNFFLNYKYRSLSNCRTIKTIVGRFGEGGYTWRLYTGGVPGRGVSTGGGEGGSMHGGTIHGILQYTHYLRDIPPHSTRYTAPVQEPWILHQTKQNPCRHLVNHPLGC